MGNDKRNLLVIGAGFSGLLVARDLSNKFNVTLVDAKSYFEYTPGILRAYVKPSHLDHLTFELAPVIRSMGATFLWGEVTKLDGDSKCVTVKPMFVDEEEKISYDYCVLASGCNFNFLQKYGESLWFPTVHKIGRDASAWSHIDERFLEGRRRHVHEEYNKISKLNDAGASVLISGAGFIGVEFATELNHYFPNLKITIIDFLPKCLGPLPDSAAKYCDAYMKKVGIDTHYGLKYEPNSQEFWTRIGLPQRADITYLCMGVKASNYYMPADTLSERGPGGGGWILMNTKLQVRDRAGALYGKTTKLNSSEESFLYAIGDCNYACVETEGKPPAEWTIPPIPKISYPSEEQALIVAKSLLHMDAMIHRKESTACFGFVKRRVHESHWPWGAGMFATSLGPNDANFVAGANFKKGSGVACNWGVPASIQKEVIEWSKVNECKGGLTGTLIWHFVHHTPVHLWGKGPRLGYH